MLGTHLYSNLIYIIDLDRFGTIPIFRDDSRLDTETFKMAEPRSNTNLGIVLESTLGGGEEYTQRICYFQDLC